MLLIRLAMCLAAWALTVTSQLGVIIDKIESESGYSPEPWRSDQSPEPGEYQHPQAKRNSIKHETRAALGLQTDDDISLWPGMLSGNPQTEILKSHPESRCTIWDLFPVATPDFL